MAGDLLHVDFGITYLRLNTDTQQHAYVLRDGGTKGARWINKWFKNEQPITGYPYRKFYCWSPGNEILRLARQQALEEDIRPSIYTHPIGYHGHGGGTYHWYVGQSG